jgi:butyrate kinase
VLVTPALLSRIKAEGIAEKELSALLARERLVPIVHGTTYEALRDVSPLLGSRSGLNTAENPMATVAAKLAELVAV